MITWGISALSHDAALAVFKDRRLVFASHAERYSRIKNDKNLNNSILREALGYGSPKEIFYYEQPLKKLTRQIYARQWPTVNRLLKSSITGVALKEHIEELGIYFIYTFSKYIISLQLYNR